MTDRLAKIEQWYEDRYQAYKHLASGQNIEWLIAVAKQAREAAEIYTDMISTQNANDAPLFEVEMEKLSGMFNHD